MKLTIDHRVLINSTREERIMMVAEKDSLTEHCQKFKRVVIPNMEYPKAEIHKTIGLARFKSWLP